MFEVEEDLKDPSLRWRYDEDGTVVLKVYGKRSFDRDHLYFHGPNVLAIYVERDTRRQFGEALKVYRRILGERLIQDEDDQLGDVDGILRFRADKLSDIPQDFLKSSRVPPLSRSRIGVEGPDGSLVPSGVETGQNRDLPEVPSRGRLGPLAKLRGTRAPVEGGGV